MASTYLSPTVITKEALMVLHQKATFLSSINKQYDSRFANSGASLSGKIGPTLTIRNPNKFAVTSSTALDVQDIGETSQTLTVSTRRGVHFKMTAQDLTLTIDEFNARYLQPAMSVLAATIESLALTDMYKDVYQIVDGDTVAFDFVHASTAQENLNNALAPQSQRTLLLKNKHVNKFMVATKGLFNPQGQLSRQFSAGELGNICDFDVKATSLANNFTTGSAAKTTGYTVNGATQNGATITIQTGSTTFLKGDIVTFAGANRVHPETKVDTGVLQTFAVTADSGANATSLAITPSLVTATENPATQNVSAYPTNTGAVVKVGAGANELLDQSLGFNKDAFTFVTADLINPSKEGCWGAVQVMDNISMRIVRQYDITNDAVPARIDVLFGYKTIRPELATRLHADG